MQVWQLIHLLVVIYNNVEKNMQIFVTVFNSIIQTNMAQLQS